MTMDKGQEAGSTLQEDVITTQPLQSSHHLTPEVPFETVTVTTATQTTIPIPLPIPGVPPGLELLHSAQAIILTDWKFENLQMDYKILDNQGNPLFKASVDCQLENDYFHLVEPCFTANVFTPLGQLVLNSKGCPRKPNAKIDVDKYGSCKIANTFCGLFINNSGVSITGIYFKMADVNGKVGIIIEDPGTYCCCTCRPCYDGEFKVFQPADAVPDSTEQTKKCSQLVLVGKIPVRARHRWTIPFPNGFDVRMKAVVLGSFLVIVTDILLRRGPSDFEKFCEASFTCHRTRIHR